VIGVRAGAVGGHRRWHLENPDAHQRRRVRVFDKGRPDPAVDTGNRDVRTVVGNKRGEDAGPGVEPVRTGTGGGGGA
jgi:hypothetical protein